MFTIQLFSKEHIKNRNCSDMEKEKLINDFVYKVIT